MLKIDETRLASGHFSSTYLDWREDVLHIGSEALQLPVPAGALAAVMQRFGGPLDPAERLTEVASLTLTDDVTVRHVRHLSGYDVVPRDYIVYESAGFEPLCALATTVAGALTHLARAAAQVSGY